MAWKKFTDAEADAIRAIAKEPVETKLYVDAFGPGRFLNTGYAVSGVPNVPGAPTGRVAINVFGNIPRAIGAAVGDTIAFSEQVVGNEFESVGAYLRFVVKWAGTVNWRIKVSLVSSDIRTETPWNLPANILDTDYNWLDQNTVLREPTMSRMNPASFNVLKVWNFHSYVDQQTMQMFKCYHPIKGKKKLVIDDTVSADDNVKVLANRNYYWIFEWYFPWPGNPVAYLPTATNYVALYGDFGTYFKDP